MGITVDGRQARRRLEEAVDLAQEPGVELPDEWIERTREVGRSPSRTFVAMLGTALLARATDDRIDPLALKETSGERAYSARSVGHQVLVPAAVEFQFHLGATGREPLNNQPFFRYNRVDEMERVIGRARPALEHLIETLRRIDQMSKEQALWALAAFLRVRMEVVAQAQQLTLERVGSDVDTLIDASTRFLAEDPEAGRRGQAFVAAVFDLVFTEVRMGRIHDPSRKLPGDVQGLQGGRVILAAEVRQKPVAETEVMRFAARLETARIRRGMVAALAAGQPSLPVEKLRRAVWERHKVMMMIMTQPVELLLGALAWGPRPVEEQLADFPARMLERLKSLEVSEVGQQTWVDLHHH
jgi:hypothetical protein